MAHGHDYRPYLPSQRYMQMTPYFDANFGLIYNDYSNFLETFGGVREVCTAFIIKKAVQTYGIFFVSVSHFFENLFLRQFFENGPF